MGKFADFLVLKGHWQELFYRVGENQIQSVYKLGRKLKLT
jgi:imidazolonepropionase-like amidohydrolase